MRHAFLIAIALTAGALGCEERCDPDQQLRNNLCFATGAGSDAGPQADAASGPPAEAGACIGPAAGFGDKCKDDMDCRCGTTLCARQPGTPEGFCTKRGCKEDASLCPMGWTCFDATAFNNGMPLSLCVK